MTSDGRLATGTHYCIVFSQLGNCNFGLFLLSSVRLAKNNARYLPHSQMSSLTSEVIKPNLLLSQRCNADSDSWHSCQIVLATN
eukprot:scaffold4026_cov117-Cylindrotheca_fusiformis.AAC.13